jgi:hypothetical protein
MVNLNNEVQIIFKQHSIINGRKLDENWKSYWKEFIENESSSHSLLMLISIQKT